MRWKPQFPTSPRGRGSSAILLAVAAAGLAAVLPGCGASSSAGGGLAVGWASPIAADPASAGVEQGLSCYLEQHGGRLSSADAALDPNKQATQVTDFINRKTSVVSIGVDPVAFQSLVRRAKSRKVPLVEMFNPGSTAAGTVFQRPAEYGKDAARTIRSTLGARARVLVIGGPPVPLVQAISKGFLDAAGAAGVQVAGAAYVLNLDPGYLRNLADTMFSKHPDANAVFAYDELAARIVAQVARQRGKQGFVALGVGGSPAGVAAVKSGLLTVMYGQGEFQSGYAAGRLLDRLREGQAVKPEVVPYQRFTKDNLDTYVNSDQLCRKATGS